MIPFYERISRIIFKICFSRSCLLRRATKQTFGLPKTVRRVLGYTTDIYIIYYILGIIIYYYILYIYIYILSTYLSIYLSIVFILSQGFSIPYRKLIWVGFEPTTLRLPCTHSNHGAIWPNDETCFVVYRIKWPRSSTHG